jgi:hypothetical protein
LSVNIGFWGFLFIRHLLIYCIGSNPNRDLPVFLPGERLFTARVQAWQYGVRFLVDIDGVEVVLERDDAGEFRAILPEGYTGKSPDKALIGGIIDVLQAL